MVQVHDVKLEIVRPGPPHNQLLSPLTAYMALCGDGSPITFRIDFEHRQLLNRLERLRYVTFDEKVGPVQVPDSMREAQVRELGEDMGQILARIPSLNAELSRSRSRAGPDGDAEFVHVRLVLSGSELSVLPFELARAPQSFPGEGLDLCLQGSLPVVVTREIRRSHRIMPAWNKRAPKVLFICAEPAGMTVPKVDHVRALRQALDPWIDKPAGTQDADAETKARLESMRKHLRVLPDASVEAIYEICATEDFTHVHILAHGDHYKDAGEDRFGLALCRKDRPGDKQVVDGEQLAKALRADREDGVGRSDPLMVTLATCDSGQQGSVLVPGGSIAHDLHAAGIPWVFASQFPLTKRGSVRMADFLYPRLLRGDDPRQVLYELRRMLSMTAVRQHDWASIVVYATVESGLEQEVAAFFEDQTVRAINVLMARADKRAEKLSAETRAKAKTKAKPDANGEAESAGPHDLEEEIEKDLEAVHALLERWQKRIARGDTLEQRKARVNCFGMKGSTLKRMGILHASLDRQSDAEHEFNQALQAYRKAMDEWVTEEAKFNWTASQYLALCAVLDSGWDAGTYAVCRKLAERDLEDPNRGIQAWAHGTLAELDLIGLFGEEKRTRAEVKVVKDSVVGHCREIVELMGPTSFQVESTRRQFQRYAEQWLYRQGDERSADWQAIAQDAVKALSEDGAE